MMWQKMTTGMAGGRCSSWRCGGSSGSASFFSDSGETSARSIEWLKERQNKSWFEPISGSGTLPVDGGDRGCLGG